jgi:hypothetical protein
MGQSVFRGVCVDLVILLVVAVSGPLLLGGCEDDRVDSPDYESRARAVAAITDQAELARLVRGTGYSDVRHAAVQKLTDQALLFDLAMGDGLFDSTPTLAAETLTDQALLLKLAAFGKTETVRKTAESKVNRSEADLEGWRLIFDPAARVRYVAQLPRDAPMLRLLAGHLDTPAPCLYSLNTPERIARIKLAIQHPGIVRRLPGLVCDIEVSVDSKTYTVMMGIAVGEKTIKGERITVAFRQGDNAIVKKTWSPAWPEYISIVNGRPQREFIGAAVNGEELLTELLRQDVFSREDLTELACTGITELDMAAVANVSSQADLASLAAPPRCTAWLEALKKLTAQDTLGRLAMESDSPSVRGIATEKLTDESMLQRIAEQDKNDDVRKIAVERLKELGRGN